MAPVPSNFIVRHVVPLSGLSRESLIELSRVRKLALSGEDMLAVQQIFAEAGREPSDVELEVIAQTWSEHCKHRIFNALIEHETIFGKESVDSLYKTYVKDVTAKISELKPGFVLSAFHDNAGFVTLDDALAVCLKVETHNHPSAIEPYAGANTGMGGVIRDILGAGKGAKPIANLDVFCFGRPDTPVESIKSRDVIPPLGILRGVVRGVRDYGNRMGIPTTGGAIQFDDTYIYNPLVFCGTLGVIPKADIAKEVKAGQLIIAAGGRTGRDGLRGATFSSASLTTDSHEEDQSAVQIGNPIEEKKVLDFLMDAREANLIEFVTDCGAGGFSSAAGEMLSETGGEIFLERAPLKEEGLISWEIYLSESQERMVFSANPENLPQLQTLAKRYGTELCVLGHADGSGILRVHHENITVCELDCQKLHEAPRRRMSSRWIPNAVEDAPSPPVSDALSDLQALLADFAICSRAPIIREYDHEVQGNTLLKPLAGASGQAPQDGSVLRIDGSKQAVAMALSILPEWGKTNPHAMGRACVDETLRQLACVGANPDKAAILDNFCVGNPDDPTQLGQLVECVKGMAEAALSYQAPFVSGKDSFYNYFITDEGPVSIPVTLLVSGFAVVEDEAHVTGSSFRRVGSEICLIGLTREEMGGSVWARQQGFSGGKVPTVDCEANLAAYRNLHRAIAAGKILSTHDLSEGGLAVALAEMTFSGKCGARVDLALVPAENGVTLTSLLFGESTGRILVELPAGHAAALGWTVIGRTTEDQSLVIHHGDINLLTSPIEPLQALWSQELARYY